MGNISPSCKPPRQHQQHQTKQQIEIQHLAERMPFGDSELLHLYSVYHKLLASRQQQQQVSSSFLTEWSIQCSKTTNQTERETLFQVIESQILPQDWGLRLYQTAFCTSQHDDVFVYADQSTEGTALPTTTLDSTRATDEHMERSRLEAFLEGVASSGRRGAKQTLTVLLRSCASYDQQHDSCQAHEIAKLAYRIALATAFLKATVDETLDMSDYVPSNSSNDDDSLQLDALAQSMLQRARDRRMNMQQQQYTAAATVSDSNGRTSIADDAITLDELIEWCDATAPLFASILPTFMHSIFFPDRPFPPSRTAFSFPYSLQESSLFESLKSPRLFALACFSSALSGSFFRLYSSDHDGLSFNRLQNALVGYSGPTLIVIRSIASSKSSSNSVFGAFTASQWKESKDFYGLADCFLYQLSPRTCVYRPTGSNQRFMYLNPNSRSKGYDQQAHGLGFGGTVDQPRLFLAENFDDNVAASVDLTFDNGLLLAPGEDGVGSQRTQFAIDCLEVWGVGGDEVVEQALGARNKVRAMKDEGIRRARKVDKAQFLDDFRSGAIASKAFAYRDQIDGRADQDVAERANDQKDILG
ncbi:hypothetical protein MPSEU_000406400 [Mayamaea pseudoterrestris]|nr:hypothetical protein MPSEU_000406400 [Mayamaea pseudoterrestris]